MYHFVTNKIYYFVSGVTNTIYHIIGGLINRMISKQVIDPIHTNNPDDKLTNEISTIDNTKYSIKKQLRIICKQDKKISVNKKNLKVGPSTKPDAGMGLFAMEDINQGEIFMECDVYGPDTDRTDLGKMINDLAWNDSLETYDTDINIQKHINAGYVVQYDHDFMIFFGGQPNKVYLYATKNIRQGEELSRLYGYDYWSITKFWNRFPNNKIRTSNNMVDLPNEYVFIDEIRSFLEQNYHMNLYGKKINDKYYYFVANCSVPYHHHEFADKLKHMYDVTKSDYAPYLIDEKFNIPGPKNSIMYMTHFLCQKRFDTEEREQNFWTQYHDSNYRKTKNSIDLPSEYILIDGISHDDVPEKHALYAKKINNEYHYLMDTRTQYMCYGQLEKQYYFPISPDDMDKYFINVSKTDFSSYDSMEPIGIFEQGARDPSGSRGEPINGMYGMAYYTVLEQKKEAIKTDEYNKFWAKHPDCKFTKELFNDLIQTDDIPADYISIMKVVHRNRSIDGRYIVYCKKIDNKHYYKLDLKSVGYIYDDKRIKYYQHEFQDELKNFVDISKPDLSQYQIDEPIPNDMVSEEYSDKQLDQRINMERQSKIDFWNDHSYSAYNKTKQMTDLPNEYVFVTDLKQNFNDGYTFDLFGKRDSDNKYYYLIGPKKNGWFSEYVHYYLPQFKEESKLYVNATKSDHTMYISSECVCGKYFFKSHLNKLFLDAC